MADKFKITRQQLPVMNNRGRKFYLSTYGNDIYELFKNSVIVETDPDGESIKSYHFEDAEKEVRASVTDFIVRVNQPWSTEWRSPEGK